VAKHNPKSSRFRWCSRIDVLNAFWIVGQEVRSKCHRYEATGLTQVEACDLAKRLKEQRDLIRQLADRRNFKHARRLMRLNRGLRKRLVGIVEGARLNNDILFFK
jgi:hypothetical protein